jgi:flagellar basal-body rod modification protein FlgD
MLPVTAPTDPTQAGASTDPSSSALSSTTNSLANETTFLKLLVAQVQNQDPLNPADSIQFVSQLAQFSSLEQLLGINQGVQSLVTNTTPSSGTTPATTGASQ